MAEADTSFHLLGNRTVDDVTTIGWQAHQIIASILADPSPDLAAVKQRLARCVAAHPGSPESALLAHLMETSEMANADG